MFDDHDPGDEDPEAKRERRREFGWRAFAEIARKYHAPVVGTYREADGSMVTAKLPGLAGRRG